MGYRLALANTTVPAGNVVSNTTTRTTFADTAIAIDPNGDIGAGNGQLFTFTGYGYISSAASSPGTLALSVAYVNTGSTTILGTATINLPISLANAGFMIQGFVLVTATGQSQGKLACQGFLTVDNAGAPISGGIVNVGTGSAGQIAPTNGTAGNQNMLLGVAAQFSVANAANSVTLSQLIVEAKS